MLNLQQVGLRYDTIECETKNKTMSVIGPVQSIIMKAVQQVIFRIVTDKKYDM